MAETNSCDNKNHPPINDNNKSSRGGSNTGSFSPTTIPECQFFIATDDEREGKIRFYIKTSYILVKVWELGHVKLQKQIDVKEVCSQLAFRSPDHFSKRKKKL